MNIKIGMSYEDVRKLFDINDIESEQDIRNGYYWIRGWYLLFSRRTYMSLCFKNGSLWMINIYPHYSENIEREPFSISEKDKIICDKWVEEHKNDLPTNVEVYYDNRTPEVGICIR